jgi:hypothetical protein
MATLPETLKKLKADKHVLKQEIEEIKRLFIEQNGRTPSRRDLSGDGQKKYTRYEEASAAFHHCKVAKTALDARFGGAQIDSARVVWAAEKREPLAIDDDSEAHTALITVVILLDTDRAVAFAQLTGEKNAELSEGVFELGCVRSLPDVQSQLRVTSSAGRLSISIEQPPPVVIASPGTAIANAPETSTDLPVPGDISLTSESSIDGGVSGTGAGDANEELVSEQPPAAGIVDKSQLTEDCSGNGGARTSSATTKPMQGKKKSARVMPAGENEERDGKKRAGNEENDNRASKESEGKCGSRLLLQAKLKRLLSIVDLATGWNGIVEVLEWMKSLLGKFSEKCQKLPDYLGAPIFFLVGCPCVAVACATVVLLWMPLWSVRQWIRVIYRLPFGASHFVALVVQLLMTGKALDLLYTFSLVVFHYGDEFTDAITIMGWWGCKLDFDSTPVCDVNNQQKGFAIAGTVA